MNYIKHLTGFFDKVMRDDNLNPTHISLYVSLFQFWNVQRFKNPISISRDEVMRVSKICSKATYHKCMKDLHNLGYLNYDPSFNPYRGSLVTLFNLELTHEQVQKKAFKKTIFSSASEQALNSNQTSSEQDLVSSINNPNLLNNSNSLNESDTTHANSQNTISDEKSATTESERNRRFEDANEKQEKLSSKKVAPKKESLPGTGIKPGLSKVLVYFAERNWPAVEGQKFFNHYQSNGWLVAGKTPMADWKASADKWMLNADQFSQGKTPNSGKLNVTTDKNYGEPL